MYPCCCPVDANHGFSLLGHVFHKYMMPAEYFIGHVFDVDLIDIQLLPYLKAALVLSAMDF